MSNAWIPRTVGGCALVACAALAVSACGRPNVPAREPLPEAEMAWVPLSASHAPPGLSGWSQDEQGVLWAVPERTPQLVPLRAERSGVREAGAALPIDGLRASEQLESITVVGPGRWVVGTEGHGSQGSDALLWLQRDGQRAKVVKRVSVPYRLFGVKGEDNRGIEAVCSANGQVLLFIEPVATSGSARTAMMARYSQGRFQVIRVPLTSGSGKISGIDCRLEGEQIAMVAIERHYGVSRILQLQLPRAPSAEPLQVRPNVLRDLAATIEELPNFEGISMRSDGYWLLSDNHHARITGPTEVLWVAR